MADRVATLDHERFDVSPTRGFVPDEAPLASFGDDAPDYLRRLDDLAADLPDLLEAGRLHPTVESLPDPPEGLFDDCTDRELRRLYRLTAFLASAYIHGGSKVDTLPRGAAIPLYESTSRLGRTPVLSYDAYVLDNWARRNEDRGLTPHNLRSLTNFVHIRDEEWFVVIHVAIESAAGPAVGVVGDVQQGVREADDDRVRDALGTIEDTLDVVISILERMPEHNAPENYSAEYRDYLASFSGVEYAGVPELDGPQSFRGGSGAQSSLLPALDAALGVDHGDNPLVEHLLTLRRDMPPGHRAFIEAAESAPAVRGYVVDHDDPALRAAYDDCVERLVEFRERHAAIVADYLSAGSGDATGTGGTPYARYLDSFTRDTRESLL